MYTPIISMRIEREEESDSESALDRLRARTQVVVVWTTLLTNYFPTLANYFPTLANNFSWLVLIMKVL